MIKNLATNWIEAVEGGSRGIPLSTQGEDAIIGLLELILATPQEAYKEILKIIKLKPREQTLNRLGAGPIEELLVSRPEYLEKFILEVCDLNLLKECLVYVNADEGSELEKGLAEAISRIGEHAEDKGRGSQ